jgi:2-keto-4-pentenoate hydratase/2-oxohepta-3-ene-1,7-dioic acid hydratase in catechol pathway
VPTMAVYVAYALCPLGPCITTDLDPGAATIETWVSGTLRAAGSPKELALAVEGVVARVSEVMTLLPGDVGATGTPGASGPLAAGDRVEIRIDGIGGLKNIVVRL